MQPKTLATTTNNPESGFPIAAVERDTGIARDTLRIWERRYGFPQPSRNPKGERVYPDHQVRRLQLIRRMMDQGWRPGRLMEMEASALENLAARSNPVGESTDERQTEILAALTSQKAADLYSCFARSCDQLGMRGFILEVAAPAAKMVGSRWASGQTQIFEEHLFTRTLTRFLDATMGPGGSDEETGASVLLATLPGEPHALGLLMVESLLWDKGTNSLNLGTEIPMDQLVLGLSQSGADTLALSFSNSYPYGQIRRNLTELRTLIPSEKQILIGGSGAHRLKRLPEGMARKTLHEL